jgi:lysophospholipase L1-like esterase
MKTPARIGSMLAVLAILGAIPVAGAAPGHWVTSWYAAPQPVWDSSFILPTGVPARLDNQTVRQTIRLSTGGRQLRLVFSNRYGDEAVKIGAVRLTLPHGPAQVLSFGGKPGASLPPGAQLTSDPIQGPIPSLARLTVSTYFPQPTSIRSFHWGQQQTLELAAGDRTGSAGFKAEGRAGGRLFLSAALVEAGQGTRSVVTLGDSITDGNGSTPDQDRRWPDYLAQRLAQQGVAVANAGISGARLLRDGMGRNALARIEQDVLAQPGVTDLVVLLGINDIGWPGSPFAPGEAPVTLAELTSGFAQLAASARARGVRIIAGTLPPFEGALAGTPYAGHYSDDKENLRQALNRWIRGASDFDAVVDFDAVLRDPDHRRRLRSMYDSGDHLHPGDRGYQAMAEAAAAVLAAPREAQRSCMRPAR